MDELLTITDTEVTGPVDLPRRRPEVGVVAMVPDAWDGPWMPRHHVLSRLARYYQVAWVEPAPHWRDLGPGAARAAPAVQPPPEGPLLYEPTLPSFHRPAPLARAAFRSRVRGASRLLERRGAEQVVLYLWRPTFDAARAARRWDLVCYHVDDEYSFSADDPPVTDREAKLLREADQVFIHSPGLMEKKGSFNGHTEFVPNGVDYEAFARVVPEPEDLAEVPRPRIGYTGMLKRQLDWPLLVTLARRHRQWSFVFVGARSPHPELEGYFHELSRLPNVYFLGAKSVEALGRYPQHFDVCIMPYRVNGYTHHIYPMKLHEYLAAGRPVVGSPIRTLHDFGDVVGLAGDADAWSARIHESLDSGRSERRAVQRRRAVAREHDWDVLVHRIARTLERRLQEQSARST